jgi:isochorismate synthase
MTTYVEDVFMICKEKNFPFAIYRLPDRSNTWVVAQLSPYQELNSKDDITELKGFVFAPFRNNEGQTAIVISPDFLSDVTNLSSNDLNQLRKLPKANIPNSESLDYYETSREEYEKNVLEIRQRINQGEFQKAIISRIISKEKSEQLNLISLFETLCNRYIHSFISLVHIPGIGCWMGASPELLLERTNKTITLVSLAGTQAKPEVEDTKIQWNNKDCTEQQIVTSYISNLLKEFHIHSYEMSGPETVHAGKVVHLKTIFTLDEQQLNGHARDFINRLHPTPAVWGEPKTDALEIIQQLEKHNREYYSGYLGPVNLDDQVHLYVNLRTMKILNTKFLLYVGCGITADSDPQEEWNETCIKSETLLSVIEEIEKS